MSDGLTMEAIDSRNPNAPPSVSQEFTNIAPSSRSAQFSQLSSGAQAFAKEYLPDDDNKDCIVSFEVVKELKPFKSQLLRDKAIAEGREPGAECEVYEDVTYIRKMVRGNDKLEVHRPIWPSDKREFPFAWQEFERGNKALFHGTPLAKLGGLDAPTVRALHAKNIFSVEDLALVTDTWLSNIGPGAREHRRRAIDFVESSKYAKAATASPEMIEMKSTLAEQRKMLDQAMDLLRKQAEENEALRAQIPVKGKPGRKPKAVIAEA